MWYSSLGQANTNMSSLQVGTNVTIKEKPHLGVGVVRYIGPIEFQSGMWVGIELSHAGVLFYSKFLQ